MFLAGIPIRDDLILEPARLVDDPELAAKLEDASGRMVKVLALTISERETAFRALDDPPAGLEELRGVLLREHVWRQREGLWEAQGTEPPRSPWIPGVEGSNVRLRPRAPSLSGLGQSAVEVSTPSVHAGGAASCSARPV